MPITTKDIEKNREEIENIKKGVQGYGRAIDKILDSDIKVIDYANWNVASKNIHNTLFSLKGRDSVETSSSIGDIIYSAMTEDHLSTLNIEEIISGRLKMNKEFDYLITNMPELGTALRALADDVVYGNTVNNSSIKLSYKGVNDDKQDVDKDFDKFFRPMQNITSTLHSKKMYNYDIDKETKELVFNLGVYGYQIIAQVPYTKIVNDLLYYKEMQKNDKYTKKTFKESVEFDIAKKAFSENFNEILENVKNKIVVPESLSIYNAKTLLKFAGVSEAQLETKLKTLINSKPYTRADIDELESYLESISYIDESVNVIANGYTGISDLINTGESDTIEILKQKKNKKFNIDNIKGSTYDVLDVNRIVPIFIKNELLGVYVIDSAAQEDNSIKIGITLQNILGLKDKHDKLGSGNDAYIDNLKGLVLADIAEVLNRNLDKKFLRNNSNLVEDIEFVLSQFDADTIYNSKVRFISAEYLTLFKIGQGLLGTSLLSYVKEYANMHINLLKADLMQKMFYQTDRYKVLVTNNGSRSMHGLIAKSLTALRMSLPRPSDAAIPDIGTTGGQFPRMYVSPLTEEGKELITMEKMDISPSTDNTEYLKYLRNTATGILGYPADVTDPSQNIDFAKKISNINMTTLIKVVGIQRDLRLPLSELCTKRLKYSTGDNKLEVEVSLDPPSELEQNITAEGMDKVSSKLDMYDRLIDNDPDLTDDMLKLKIKRDIAEKVLSPYIDVDLISSTKTKIELKGNLNENEGGE